eukprot:1160061-Pelagomonas_calceolata.AAC.3
MPSRAVSCGRACLFCWPGLFGACIPAQVGQWSSWHASNYQLGVSKTNVCAPQPSQAHVHFLADEMSTMQLHILPACWIRVQRMQASQQPTKGVPMTAVAAAAAASA